MAKKIFFLTLGLFLVLHVVNIASRVFLYDRTSYEPVFGISTFLSPLFMPWLNFDGINYLKIAVDGYDLQNVVFFPLFPILVRTFTFNGIINPIAIGLLLNLALSIISVQLLYRLVKKDFSDNIALRSVVLFIFFPTAFFLFAFYTETVFLLISLLFFSTLNKKTCCKARC